MRVAIYVETDADGHDGTELLLSVYVDSDESVRLTRHELSSWSEVPSLASSALAEVLGSVIPSLG